MSPHAQRLQSRSDQACTFLVNKPTSRLTRPACPPWAGHGRPTGLPLASWPSDGGYWGGKGGLGNHCTSTLHHPLHTVHPLHPPTHAHAPLSVLSPTLWIPVGAGRSSQINRDAANFVFTNRHLGIFVPHEHKCASRSQVPESPVLTFMHHAP